MAFDVSYFWGVVPSFSALQERRGFGGRCDVLLDSGAWLGIWRAGELESSRNARLAGCASLSSCLPSKSREVAMSGAGRTKKRGSTGRKSPSACTSFDITYLTVFLNSFEKLSIHL